MLEKIQIRNFQAHSKLQVEFDSQCTTIIGPSDVGKSAIIRALRWVCTNKPDGQAFIKQGASGCSVQLFIDERKIVRSRGKGTNSYKLDGHELKAFGTNVPDTISQIVNLSPVNFQQQHDAPFWFSLSAGQVSRELNAIVDLGMIDDALAAAAKGLSSARSEAAVTEDRLEAAELRLKGLGWVKEAGAEFDKVQAIRAKHTRLATQRAILGRLTVSAQSHTEIRNRAIRTLSEARTALSLGLEARKAIRSRKKLEALIGAAMDSQPVSVPKIGPVKLTAKAWKIANKRRVDLEFLIERVISQTAVVTLVRDHLLGANVDLKREMTGLCPICQKEL